MKLTIREIAILGIYGALMFALQVVMSPLPNIEPVSLMVIVLGCVYGRRGLYSLGVFILLEGLFYGFGPWWFFYLYAWPILLGLTLLVKKALGRSPWAWALFSGAFGLGFGLLYSLVFLFTGGFPSMLAAWTAGLLFDVTHCIGNFALCLALYRPLIGVMERFCGMHNA